jgi:hypothetical protein
MMKSSDGGSAGSGVEIGRNLIGVVARMLAVLVQGHLPRHLLGCRIDPDVAPQAAHRLEHLARHLSDGPIGRERDPALSPAAVLENRLVGVQIQRCDEGSGAIGRRQWKRFPATRAQPQRGVLELGLGRRELDRELSENLRVRVEGCRR